MESSTNVPSLLGPSSTSAASLPVPCIDASDYPGIKYWTKKQYIAAKKNKKTSTGLVTSEETNNTMTWYVETEEGEPVNGETAEAIRLYARAIWQSLVCRNIAPSTWADANLEAQTYYEHHMCRRFPQLSYGANNWKAHMIATENYSSWYGKHVGRVVKVKDEPAVSRALKRSPLPSIAARPSERKKMKMVIPLTIVTDSPLELGTVTESMEPCARSTFPVCVLIHRSLLLTCALPH